MRRLTWPGNIEAQRQADVAASSLKPKVKRKRKRKSRIRRRPRGAKRTDGIPYRDYLRTQHWRHRRKLALKQANYRCELCGATEELCVHHLSYERLWAELDEDLAVVCTKCHERIHDKHEKHKRGQ